MSEQEQLQAIRAEIDEVDLHIQQLLNKRATLAHKAAEVKVVNGDQGDFYRPDREAIVLRQIMARNNGPLSDSEVARLFREIMSTCLAFEQSTKVAYLGPEGSYTHLATLKQFGGAVELLAMSTITDVFRAVEIERVNYGVVPVENSTEGVVSHTFDRFISSPLKINGEVMLPVHHHLLGRSDNKTTISEIYAHPQALAQCQHWLKQHYPASLLVTTNSNSEAAQKATNRTAGAAAIASDYAAEIYGLSVLASNIEDEANNTTRFLVIGSRDIATTSGDDKTTLLVSTKNRSGALHSLLKPLADSNISMTRIESRPAGTDIWQYVFFIDIEGHHQDEIVTQTLRLLAQQSSMCRVLGSYPRAVL